ncbi:MAG TPA: T9SS type A sorting domain-containing protein, partial [Bacteroidia bacterium]|nr:T9SS type A sorting domain-containing protein [Bacteroidia bacterium]
TGIYWVDVTNGNGCVSRDSVTVTINSNPIVDLGPDATQCGSATLDAGNPGATYLWSDNSTNQTLTVSASGTYSVLVTFSGGCTASDAINITINPLPTVTLNFPNDTVCLNGGMFNLTGESPSGGTWSGNGVSGSTFDPQVPGVGFTLITYTYSDLNGCSAMDTSSLWVDVCNGVSDNVSLTNMNVFPNPNNGHFTLEINHASGNGLLLVTDALGQVISSENVVTANGSLTKEIDLGIYANGIYFIHFTTSTENTVQKISVQR